jgi:hypothetical protein
MVPSWSFEFSKISLDPPCLFVTFLSEYLLVHRNHLQGFNFTFARWPNFRLDNQKESNYKIKQKAAETMQDNIYLRNHL